MDDTAAGNFRLLEAVELVAIGIEGKRALWLALSHVSAASPKFVGPDYGQLIERATGQRQQIEAVRLDAPKGSLAEN
jgi:hypothetical protein